MPGLLAEVTEETRRGRLSRQRDGRRPCLNTPRDKRSKGSDAPHPKEKKYSFLKSIWKLAKPSAMSNPFSRTHGGNNEMRIKTNLSLLHKHHMYVSVLNCEIILSQILCHRRYFSTTANFKATTGLL